MILVEAWGGNFTNGKHSPFNMVLILGLILVILGLNTAAAGVHSLTLSGEEQLIGVSVSGGAAYLTVLGKGIAIPYHQSWTSVQAFTHLWAANLPEVPEKVNGFANRAAGTTGRVGHLAQAYWGRVAGLTGNFGSAVVRETRAGKDRLLGAADGRLAVQGLAEVASVVKDCCADGYRAAVGWGREVCVQIKETSALLKRGIAEKWQ